MRAEEKKLLLDMSEACRSIEQRCAGHSFDEYTADRLASAVAARITSLRHIVDFRNRIIHGYDSVDDVIVWRTVQHHLPALKAEVERLLEEDGSPPGERFNSSATP
jgi:uncharacterized protein with HEPN domain